GEVHLGKKELEADGRHQKRAQRKKARIAAHRLGEQMVDLMLQDLGFGSHLPAIDTPSTSIEGANTSPSLEATSLPTATMDPKNSKRLPETRKSSTGALSTPLTSLKPLAVSEKLPVWR